MPSRKLTRIEVLPNAEVSRDLNQATVRSRIVWMATFIAGAMGRLRAVATTILTVKSAPERSFDKVSIRQFAHDGEPRHGHRRRHEHSPGQMQVAYLIASSVRSAGCHASLPTGRSAGDALAAAGQPQGNAIDVGRKVSVVEGESQARRQCHTREPSPSSGSCDDPPASLRTPMSGMQKPFTLASAPDGPVVARVNQIRELLVLGRACLCACPRLLLALIGALFEAVRRCLPAPSHSCLDPDKTKIINFDQLEREAPLGGSR
jgi:hypothetical protein